MEFSSKAIDKILSSTTKVSATDNYNSLKTEIKNHNIASNANKIKKYSTDRDIYDFLALVEEEFIGETQELDKFKTIIEEITLYLHNHGSGNYNFKIINDIIPNNEISKNGGMNNSNNEILNFNEIYNNNKDTSTDLTKNHLISKEDKKLYKDKQDYKFLENSLLKIRDLLIKKPILMIELNKFLPKPYKLAVIDKDFTCKFLLKIKNKSEDLYNQIVTILMNNKNSVLTFKDLYDNIEKLLKPVEIDLYNDFILIMEVKRYSEIKQPYLNKIKNNNSLLGKKIIKPKSKDMFGPGLNNKGIKFRNSLLNSNNNIEEKSDSMKNNNHLNLKSMNFGKQNGIGIVNSFNVNNLNGNFEEFVTSYSNISELFKKDLVSNNQYVRDSNYGINCKIYLY